METSRHDDARLVTVLRRSLTALAGLSAAATAAELAMLRHWDSQVQLIPWYALGGFTVAFGLFVARPIAPVLRLVRTLCALEVLASLVGVYEHFHENLIAGPLDYRYTDRWDHMSAFSRWWTAATETVGPAPTLAALALFEAAVLLWLATLRHPAFRDGDGPTLP